LTSKVSASGIWGAVTEYFSDGWWEEVFIFYASIRRDVGPLISELHRLLTRWLTLRVSRQCSSFDQQGSVATALLQIDPGLERYQYRIYND
jgi:hypothetical protein